MIYIIPERGSKYIIKINVCDETSITIQGVKQLVACINPNIFFLIKIMILNLILIEGLKVRLFCSTRLHILCTVFHFISI